MKVFTELKRHSTDEKRQGSVWQCNKCTKVFSKKYNLDRHAVLHTGNFRWYCEMCKKGFAQKKCIMCICVHTKVSSIDVNIVVNHLLDK